MCNLKVRVGNRLREFTCEVVMKALELYTTISTSNGRLIMHLPPKMRSAFGVKKGR